MGSYEKIQETEAKKLVYDLLVHPDQPTSRHFMSFAAVSRIRHISIPNLNNPLQTQSIVMTMSYGTRCSGLDDDSVVIVEAIQKSIIADASPGAHLIELAFSLG